MKRARLAIFGPLPPPTTGMEAFTETLLSQLRGVPPSAAPSWIHVDTSISASIAEREKVRVRKVLRLVGQTARSVRLAGRGFDAYYPISQNRIGLWRDVALLAPFRAAGRTIVVHLHGGMLDRVLEGESPLLRRSVRWLLSGPSARAIVLTPSLRRCFQDLLPRDRIEVVANTATVPDWTAEKTADGPLRVLFIGTLVESKGYRELVRAVASLADAGAPIELDVAGEPYAAEDARWLEENADHPSVHLLGRVAGDAKWHALRRAHVLALPTTYPPEGQPISIIEGMAAACAIVATAREGILDTVGPREGVLLEPRSGSGLQADLERVLLDLSRERDRVGALGRAARDRYERELAPERFIDAWLAAVADGGPSELTRRGKRDP